VQNALAAQFIAGAVDSGPAAAWALVAGLGAATREQGTLLFPVAIENFAPAVMVEPVNLALVLH
jgi:hypothetical protein